MVYHHGFDRTELYRLVVKGCLIVITQTSPTHSVRKALSVVYQLQSKGEAPRGTGSVSRPQDKRARFRADRARAGKWTNVGPLCAVTIQALGRHTFESSSARSRGLFDRRGSS